MAYCGRVNVTDVTVIAVSHGELEFAAMSKRLVVMTVEGEPQWCLDGKALSYEPLFMVRDGVEVWGVFETDGDEPPGKPFFQPHPTDRDPDPQRVEVRPELDEFHRLGAADKWKARPEKIYS